MSQTKISSLLSKNKEYEGLRTQKINQNTNKEEDDANFWEKAGATLADIFTEVGGGFFKLGEGVVDAALSITNIPVIGTGWWIEKIAGEDNLLENAIKYDAAGNLWYSWEDELTKNSVLNDAPIVKDIIRGVGQQLPSIAATIAAPFTGGASLAALPYTIGATVASAGGSGVEEALNEDADFGQALAYGALQAGIEGAVEAVTGGMGKGITSIGKSIGKNVGKSVAKSAGKIILEESAQEFVEEGLSALLNPLTKITYQGSDALETYRDMTFYLNAAQQALVGGVVGGLTGSAGAIAQTKLAGGKSNYNIAQSVQEIAVLNKKEANLWKNNKLDSNKIEQIDIQRQAELKNISEKLQSMDENSRKETIKKYELSSLFNPGGTILAEINESVGGKQTNNEQSNTNRKPLISDNIQAYSPNVRNEILKHAPTSNQLSDSAVNTKNFILKLNPNAKMVIADNLGDANAFYDTNSRIFYFSNEATTKQLADTVAGHEFTHSLEGTKEYKALADYILNNTENLKTRIGLKIAQYSKVNTEIKQSENGQEVALYEAQTEIVAEEMGKLLSDPKSIERIVNQNKSLAHRIIQWVKDVMVKLGNSNNEYYSYLRNVEKLYAEAIKKSIGGISLSDVAAFAELEKLAKQEEKLAKEKENAYNKTKEGNVNGQFAEARYSIDGRDNLGDIQGQVREHQVRTLDDFRKTPERAFLESEESRQEYLNIIKNGEHTKVGIDYIAKDNFISYLEIKESSLVPVLTELREENTKLGFKTKFVIGGFNVNGNKNKYNDAIGLYSTTHDTIYLKVTADEDITITNNHERMHNIERKYPEIFNDFRLEVKSLFGDNYKNAVESIIEDWGLIDFSLKEKEFLSEFFAGGERLSFEESVLLQRDKIVEKYRNLIADKGNLKTLRFSLKDSDGNKLSEQQQEYFKNSKARDENGNLVVVYHGTEGEFYAFDKALRGANTGTKDAKLGFFFTNQEIVARDYAIYAQDGKIYNLMNLIARGDSEVISLLKKIDGHKKLEQTELVKEFAQLVKKTEEFRHDILKVYLNLENPKVVDWQGKVYKKNSMLKLITEAIMDKYDGVIIKNIEDSVDQSLGVSDVYVAFEPNQIKLTTNKNPTLNEDMRYSLNDKSEYTKEEYNNFGWVRANEVLNVGEYKNFTEKFAKAVTNGVKFNKTKDGYFMIPVSDIYSDMEGIENAIVFAKGKIESPEILKVLKIDLDNETDLSIVREDIYENESRGIQTENTKIFRCYNSGDVNFSVWSEKRKRNSVISQNSNGITNGKGNNRKIRSVHFNEDGSQEITYYEQRFSLKDGEGDYNYSKGQIAKYVAEHSKLKAYSKTDAEQIINTIVSTQLGYGNKYGDLSNKTKNQVINTLWYTLNTNNEGYRAKAVLDIADYIINNAIMEDIYGDSNNEVDLHIVGVLKNYLHKIDLNSIKSEIKYRYGSDNSPYLTWGKRSNERGQSSDQVSQEIAEKGIFIEAVNEADIFFEIDKMYRNATKNLKKTAKEKLAEIASKEDLAELKQKIAKELLISFDDVGHKTMFANTIEKYTSKISQLKQTVKDIKAFNKAKNNAISTIERLRDEFVKSKPAGWKVPQQVSDFVKKIARVETWRNNFSKTAREHLLELNNQIDLVMDETQQQIYPFRETLRELGSGKGEFTTQELQTLDTILRQFAWQLRNYNKVNFEDSVQDVDVIAAQGVHESKQARKILKDGENVLIKFKNKVYTNPYDRLAEMGLYRENSIAMRLYKDMLQGDRNRAKLLYEVNQSFNSFFDKNKGYLKELQKTITFGDVTLTKRQALALYCTSLREQGKAHLFNQGYNSGVVRILDNKYSTQGKVLEAFAKGNDVTITADMITQIKDSLTEADKAYLEVVDNFFNKISKQAKKETDQKLYGITNIEEGYYFPLKVSSDKIYTEAGQNNLNVNQYILDLGMNKSTKPHASNKIVIDGIDNIISNHLQNLSLYYGYAVPLTAYNRIMNRQVMEFEGADSTSNMRGEIQKIDVDFEGYMNRLWQDVQGIRRSDKGFVSSLLSKIRWAGANSALGANPKVLVTQTLSLAAGISEFNPKYVAKGMGHFFGEKQKLELAKYSSLMWERMQIGNSVDIAEIRQIGKEIGAAGKITARATKFLNDFTTKPISWMDSNVIQSLWFAAQYEVADTKGKGFEFGTEANKTEAGKRLDEVVFRTQQTSDPLGRSEWMRSQNEIVKFARMFTGDALQLTGRLISSVNKYNIAKKMIKNGDAILVEQGQKMFDDAKQGVAKAGSAFILNQIMLLAIAMAFKWLKGKDDDEEWSEIAKNEAIANIMGLIPFGGDIYDKFLGYEPTNMAYTALSNTVEIVQDFYEGFSTLISGDYQDSTKRNAAIRKTALSMSRLFGISAQNLESYIKGIVGHVAHGTREEWEARFKIKSNTQYLKKIKQATEDGNEELAESIINIMFDSRTGKIKDDKVLDAKRSLIELGYDVIPKSVGESITYDGVEYKLTSRQHSKFMQIYSQANESVKAMVNNYMFNRIDEEAQAKAMNFIYNYYYNLAIEDMLGEDLESKTILFAEAIPIEQLAMAIAQAQLYSIDVDKTGKTISGTRKAKIQSFIQGLKLTATQKYMIMGYLGYSNKYGKSLVKGYINQLSLTKQQKEKLFDMSGYVA